MNSPNIDTTTKPGIDEKAYQYLLSVSLREPQVLAELRQETAKLPMSMMQVSSVQGQFLSLLVQLIGAKKTLEVGVFTGYSSLATALALPEDGKIIACDVNEKFTQIAHRYWQKAGVADKIDLKIAPALDTLNRLIAQGEAGSFDFAFIDADKINYLNYYEKTLELLRPGGLIAIDNVLWWKGDLVEPELDEQAVAIADFNRKLHQDKRVTISMLPVADGLTLAVKN
ncbi:class I SAM-dependent methyltransferase [Pleurocapsa sp. FMAR1]|uniref:class I SAM-dependent methyltransferase n=1 Tax=Pleurocapsa sp. FMAR1 TaxID=3040204 RepID=UPI0029C9464A|nr:class I SAM-dependent methyltransferase [Pleurocapsa sp. FMAR1]